MFQPRQREVVEVRLDTLAAMVIARFDGTQGESEQEVLIASAADQGDVLTPEEADKLLEANRAAGERLATVL